jgi:hypothetical protein
MDIQDATLDLAPAAAPAPTPAATPPVEAPKDEPAKTKTVCVVPPKTEPKDKKAAPKSATLKHHPGNTWLFQNPTFSDVEVRSKHGGPAYACHRTVLGAVPYFLGLLAGDATASKMPKMSEARSPGGAPVATLNQKAILLDLSPGATSLLMRYAYQLPLEVGVGTPTAELLSLVREFAAVWPALSKDLWLEVEERVHDHEAQNCTPDIDVLVTTYIETAASLYDQHKSHRDEARRLVLSLGAITRCVPWSTAKSLSALGIMYLLGHVEPHTAMLWLCAWACAHPSIKAAEFDVLQKLIPSGTPLPLPCALAQMLSYGSSEHVMRLLLRRVLGVPISETPEEPKNELAVISETIGDLLEAEGARLDGHQGHSSGSLEPPATKTVQVEGTRLTWLKEPEPAKAKQLIPLTSSLDALPSSPAGAPRPTLTQALAVGQKGVPDKELTVAPKLAVSYKGKAPETPAKPAPPPETIDEASDPEEADVNQLNADQLAEADEDEHEEGEANGHLEEDDGQEQDEEEEAEPVTIKLAPKKTAEELVEESPGGSESEEEPSPPPKKATEPKKAPPKKKEHSPSPPPMRGRAPPKGAKAPKERSPSPIAIHVAKGAKKKGRRN